MENFKIWIFILFTGLLSTPSRCCEKNEELEFNGQKSGLYFVHNDDETNGEGVSYMFEKINGVAVHAIFQYKYTDYAANVTRDMLIDAIKSKTSENGPKSKKPWKSVLEEVFKTIELKLLDPPAELERSRSTVALVVIDGNTAIQAQVGNVRIVSLTTDGKFHVSEGIALCNILGGKQFRKQNSVLRGDAQVTELKNTRFIVMGTIHFFGPNDDNVAQIIFEQMDNLKDAAHNIAQLMNSPSAKNNNAVIAIGLHPTTIKKSNSLLKTIQKFAANCITANGSPQ